tara:strand:+ start:223 stop:1377 length:1155 start_codon:yes stop_codon:yes gene_type:complete
MNNNINEVLAKETARIQQKILKGMENMLKVDDIETGVTPHETVYREDMVEVHHYKPIGEKTTSIPLLVTYALVNRQYMMDLQQDRSLFRKLLEAGNDLYVIDWGYPSKMHKYISMEDYILGYMDNVIDFIREHSNNDKINLMGVCQGGTFSLIYASLIPEKIRNLVLMVTPVDFDTHDSLLNVWSKVIDADLMIDVMGNIPGEFMNMGFLWLKPFALILDKYVGLLDNVDNPDVAENFIRMEKWIFDSPDQAGETIRQFVKDLYQANKMVKGELIIGDQIVDLSKVTMPVLNIYGEQDHLVPPHSSRCVADLVGSKDVTTKSFPLGHIGMYVSSRSQREVAPTVTDWLIHRSTEPEESDQVSQSVPRKSAPTAKKRRKGRNDAK